MRKVLVGIFAVLIMVFGIYGYSSQDNQIEIMDDPAEDEINESFG